MWVFTRVSRFRGVGCWVGRWEWGRGRGLVVMVDGNSIVVGCMGGNGRGGPGLDSAGRDVLRRLGGLR